MAENKEYVYEIILRNDSDDGTESATATSDKSVSAQPNPKDLQGEFGSLKGIALAKIAENIAYSAISYNASTIALRTGQNEYQSKMQLLAEGSKRVFDIGVSALTGSLLAGGIGAVVGVVAGVAMQAISIEQAQNTINLQNRLESLSIQEANIRAGAGGSRASKNEY